MSAIQGGVSVGLLVVNEIEYFQQMHGESQRTNVHCIVYSLSRIANQLNKILNLDSIMNSRIMDKISKKQNAIKL